MDILNAKDFVIDKKIVGHCKLHLERSEIRQADLDTLDDRDIEIKKKWSTFGIIQLSGVVEVDDQKDLSVMFTLITSEIDSMAVIDDSLISKTMDSQGKEILNLTIPEVFTISEESKIIDYY
ncbi:hypothetical protein M8998_07175 [Sphingobacterium sp. lm-10]|uniref:hypothetical protein n=1 Tax=Sphingobacterium sp. lm-10 TaxID=2944904 RepID=UPI0020226430|nr:hypothetical protein [Sphingobacterium sp. lm-10]MCL7987715.1 hypothetical protein [Sphingobacterium sp. lm-10]